MHFCVTHSASHLATPLNTTKLSCSVWVFDSSCNWRSIVAFFFPPHFLMSTLMQKVHLFVSLLTWVEGGLLQVSHLISRLNTAHSVMELVFFYYYHSWLLVKLVTLYWAASIPLCYVTILSMSIFMSTLLLVCHTCCDITKRKNSKSQIKMKLVQFWQFDIWDIFFQKLWVPFQKL